MSILTLRQLHVPVQILRPHLHRHILSELAMPRLEATTVVAEIVEARQPGPELLSLSSVSLPPPQRES